MKGREMSDELKEEYKKAIKSLRQVAEDLSSLQRDNKSVISAYETTVTQLEAENADLRARIDALTSYEPEVFVNDLKKQNVRLRKVLKEVRTFLEVAPFDFHNGNTYGPYDEGDVIGWEHHKKLLDEVKEACDD